MKATDPNAEEVLEMATMERLLGLGWDAWADCYPETAEDSRIEVPGTSNGSTLERIDAEVPGTLRSNDSASETAEVPGTLRQAPGALREKSDEP